MAEKPRAQAGVSAGGRTREGEVVAATGERRRDTTRRRAAASGEQGKWVVWRGLPGPWEITGSQLTE